MAAASPIPLIAVCRGLQQAFALVNPWFEEGYWRGVLSRSLRWTIAGHMCADLFGLSVPVLLNLHVPSGP